MTYAFNGLLYFHTFFRSHTPLPHRLLAIFLDSTLKPISPVIHVLSV